MMVQEFQEATPSQALCESAFSKKYSVVNVELHSLQHCKCMIEISAQLNMNSSPALLMLGTGVVLK